MIELYQRKEIAIETNPIISPLYLVNMIRNLKSILILRLSLNCFDFLILNLNN